MMQVEIGSLISDARKDERRKVWEEAARMVEDHARTCGDEWAKSEVLMLAEKCADKAKE